MAMIRSSMGKVIRRALSVRNPQPLRRCKHDGPAADSTSAARKVEQLAKKAEEVAKKEVLFEYVESIVKEQKKEYGSPKLKGTGISLFHTMAYIALFMTGYRLGIEQATSTRV